MRFFRELRTGYLLIDRIGGVVHQNRAFLVIQFAIHTCVPDQVNNPLFAFVLVQAKACREIPITNILGFN